MRIFLITLILSFSFAINPLLLVGISGDKAMHGAGGYIITDTMETKGASPLETLVFMYGVGMLKEQLDVWCGGEWDNKDIGAGIIGWGMYRLVHFEIGF